MNEVVGRGGLLDISNEAILPQKFSEISPSKPREWRREVQLREGHRKGY